ncbi:MAG: hypothetical protein ABR915_25265, partial [Thermoguttaceae bacterium]
MTRSSCAMGMALLIAAAFGPLRLTAGDDIARPPVEDIHPRSAEVDWSVPARNGQAVQPGEHPRLIFRKSDLPELRRRAETPEGKIILQRCRDMLAKRFTTWNAAGHAFLYQITGDAKYAEEAKEAMLQTLSAKANPDGRYTWPGKGQLRTGPCVAAVGLAYDMAYDGWDEATRKKVADAIIRNAAPIAERPSHGPGCNHWGAHSGGAGIGLLALRGDTVGDPKRVEELLEKVVKNVRRELVEGFGDHAYYGEGHYCGRISANTGVIPFIQAYRVAAGRDLVPKCSNAQWQAAKWVYELVRFDNQVRNIQRGMYARDPFTRGDQLSGDGDFAQGFGIVPERYKAALLWTFNHVVQPGEEKDYDMLEYPHLAAYALANWPLGMKEQNPGEILPKAMVDATIGYYVFRNGWTGTEQDVVVTALLGSAGSMGRGMGKGGSLEVVGMGVRYVFPGMFYLSKTGYFKAEPDGSGVLSAKIDEKPNLSGSNDNKLYQQALAVGGKAATSMAVDYSGRCGAPVLVVQVGTHTNHQTGKWTEIMPA